MNPVAEKKLKMKVTQFIQGFLLHASSIDSTISKSDLSLPNRLPTSYLASKETDWTSSANTTILMHPCVTV